MRCAAVALLMMLSVFAVVDGGRNILQRDEEEEEVTYLALEEEEEVTTMAVDSGTMFELGEDSQTVEAENTKYEEQGEDVHLTHLLEIRTKLKFIGNQVELRNPEMVGQLVEDIKAQQEQYPDSKFLFCLHVGTSASEGIKDTRPGFIEGRSQTLLDALNGHAEHLGVGETATFSESAFEHFTSTRFAGLVMKVYAGEDNPGCEKDDLVPPPA